MEEINHQDGTSSFNEIRIVISSAEENIRKLYEASRMGSIQTLNTLIQDDPDLIPKILASTSDIESPLHVSVFHGHLEFTRLLLDHKPELAAEVDALQRTPLHLACENGDMETVRALLEKNTSACLVYDKNGLIPLHYAVVRGEINIMQRLINTRPQSIWMKLNNGQTVLHLCVESNHLEALKLLIEISVNDDKDFLNTNDDAGNTILDLSLMLRQIEIVGYLLSEVKTKTRITNIASSNATKKCSKSIIKLRSRNLKRQRRESASLSSSSSSKKTTRWWKVWRKNMKYKGNWVREVQGTMMLVATVIATMTFQAAINPPGGVWQQDTQYNSSNIYYYPKPHFYGDIYPKYGNETIFPAGTAIMAYQQHDNYSFYLVWNTMSFLASVSVIILIISRFPPKNKICSWVLALTMCLAVTFLAFGYLTGVQMVSLNNASLGDITANVGYYVALFFWYGVLLLVGLCYVIRFFVWVVKSLVWVVKSLLCIFTSKFKSHRFNDATP